MIAFAREVLDQAVPLAGASHKEAAGYTLERGALKIALRSGIRVALQDPAQFKGYTGPGASPTSILLQHNGLHVEIHIDRSHPIGKDRSGGDQRLVLESAITTIMDCEDSIAAVDAEDKVLAYRNWLGLMQGSLTARFAKGGRRSTARLNPDRAYTARMAAI